MKLILSKDEWMALLQAKLEDDVLYSCTITKLEMIADLGGNAVEVEFHSETTQESIHNAELHVSTLNRKLEVKEPIPIYLDPKPSPELFKSDVETAKAFAGIPTQPFLTDDEVLP
jgi:hypothetical protein